MDPMLAHAGTPDELLATILVAAALVLLWAGSTRLRRRGFPRMPRAVAWALVGLAPVALVSAVVVPRWLAKAPGPAGGPRPASTASIAFAAPADGAVVPGPSLRVIVDLQGGRLVAESDNAVAPDTGHLHLFLNGNLQSMGYGLEQTIDVAALRPGTYTLKAEFVATDHGSFDPPVTATITFVKDG